MRSFFSKMRHDLSTNQKMSRYLKYAIGEVFLVVIGILIALQINNWNENNKARNIEVKLLMELRGDLITTKEDLVTDIDKTTRILENTNSMYLKIIEARETETDLQLSISTTALSDTPVLFPKSIAYKSIQAFGVNIISNDNLRKSLTEIYELQMERIRYIEGLLTELHESELRHYFKQFSKAENNCEECVSLFDQYKTLERAKLNTFVINNPKDDFIHIIKRRFALTNALKNLYTTLEQKIDDMVNNITMEIDNND